MIKKIMTGALLTVFMDKKARKTLHAKRTAKKTSTAVSNEDPIVALTQPRNDPLSDMGHDKITDLIKESLFTAEKEIIDKKIKPVNKVSKSADIQSREDLIENALIIFKSKSHIIDELPAEQRKKLKILALQIFGEQLKDG
jgi:hypothetical protein